MFTGVIAAYAFEHRTERARDVGNIDNQVVIKSRWARWETVEMPVWMILVR